VGAPVTFDEVLARWNGGVGRGAQTRLARRLGLAPNTVSQWVTGVSRPDGDLRPRLARELGMPSEALDRLFGPRRAAPALALRETARADGPAALPVFAAVREEPFQFDFGGAVPEEILPLSVGGGYGGRSAALRVAGDRWKPLAEDGDYLLLVESSVAQEGKWAVVRREDGCRLRRLASGPARPDDKERVVAVVAGKFRRV
jgi:transcriptional regulator with XRE-family HTH domain